MQKYYKALVEFYDRKLFAQIPKDSIYPPSGLQPPQEWVDALVSGKNRAGIVFLEPLVTNSPFAVTLDNIPPAPIEPIEVKLEPVKEIKPVEPPPVFVPIIESPVEIPVQEESAAPGEPQPRPETFENVVLLLASLAGVDVGVELHEKLTFIQSDLWGHKKLVERRRLAKNLGIAGHGKLDSDSLNEEIRRVTLSIAPKL